MSQSADEGTSAVPRMTRRRLFALGGTGVAIAGLGAVGLSLRDRGTDSEPADGRGRSGDANDVVPFYGARQAGIVTPAQDRLHFAAFDVTTQRRLDVVALLRRWTEAAAALTAGVGIGRYGAMDGPSAAPPEDTGEAFDLPASRLTITIGFGRSLFIDAEGHARFGLADMLPEQLTDLPHFPGDRLDLTRSNGDLCIQACADDPQVAVHAVRNLARLAFGTATVRWSQLGFGRTSSTSTTQQTPRNLLGFKDGTANLKAESTEAVAEHVWARADDGQPWMSDGSYLVARRINMHIETWDRTSLAEQEAIIGRQKSTGAPLSGGTEFTPINFTTVGSNSEPIVAADSHVRLAHPSRNEGHSILRRGYNFTDGTTGLGRLDAGLFFLAFVRNPATQFIPLQNRLSGKDALSEYLQHTGSALFAVPPGVIRPGGYLGETLFSG